MSLSSGHKQHTHNSQNELKCFDVFDSLLVKHSTKGACVWGEGKTSLPILERGLEIYISYNL